MMGCLVSRLKILIPESTAPVMMYLLSGVIANDLMQSTTNKRYQFGVLLREIATIWLDLKHSILFERISL